MSVGDNPRIRLEEIIRKQRRDFEREKEEIEDEEEETNSQTDDTEEPDQRN